MKQLIFTLAMLALASCQSLKSDDPSSISFSIPVGSTLSLEKSIDIPGGYSHAVLQSGELIAVSKKDIYTLLCNFELKKSGPRTIHPEVFTVRRIEDYQERIDRGTLQFYTEVYLDSDKGTDVNMLSCQRWGIISDYHFTASEIQETLGDYFSFTFKPNSK